ncbi:MAG: hypothetical protein JXB49_35150 [Bacteroidales bacterium]|nr:hypothetical protein [Bacteroidales bacterium]
MLDMPREVCLLIYNSNGYKVETLIDDYIDAGQHNILWMNKKELQEMFYLNMKLGSSVKMQTISLLRQD